MRSYYRDAFIISGYVAGVLVLLLQTWVFLKAYLSDSKSITIYVNSYGEQYGDIATFIFLWLICIIGVFFLYKKMKKISA